MSTLSRSNIESSNVDKEDSTTESAMEMTSSI